MSQTFAMEQASGPTSPPVFLSACIVLPIMCIIAIGLRFNARRVQKSGLKMDDWIMLPALIFFMGMAACAILGEASGVWAHDTPPDATNASSVLEAKLLEAFQFIQIVTLALIKLGALTFYGRIFNTKGQRTIFVIANWVTRVIVVLWTMANLMMNALQCGPHITALWDGPAEWLEFCSVISPPFEEAFSISNAIIDVWILVLPLPKIFQLHTTTKRKLAVAGVFLLAIVGLAASLARMVIYIEITLDFLGPSVDIRLVDTLSVYWSMLEAGISLLAVNLPSIWLYLVKALPEGLVASIRSMISLASLRSTGSNSRTRTRLPSQPEGSTHSTSSQTKFATMESNEVFAIHDIEAQNEYLQPPGVIMRTSEVRVKTST